MKIISSLSGLAAKKGVTRLDVVILLSFYLSGYAALTYEQLWAQLLSLIFGSSSYAFSAMLMAFFFGLALGSIVMWKYIGKITNPLVWFGLVELGIGVVSLALLPGFSRLDIPYLYVFRLSDSPAVIILSWVLLPALLLIPTSLMGATLPLASKIFVTNKEKIGTNLGLLFSANTFGGIFGAWWTGFVLLPKIGLERTYVLAVFTNIAVGVLLVSHAEVNYPKIIKKATYALAGLAIFWGIYLGSQELDPTSAGVYYLGTRMGINEWKELKANTKVLYNQYGVYGLVTVGEDAGIRYLSVNGKPEASNGPFDLETQYLLGYIPMLAHQKPEKVLQIGVGAGFTLSAMANFPVERIDALEINPLVIHAAKRYFAEDTGNVLGNPKVKLIVEDGRKYLATTQEKYDVIVSTPSNPWVSGVSSLFTLEFFESAAVHLNEGGILAIWAPLYEYAPGDIKILLGTLNEAFPTVQVYTSGGDMIILASEDRISFDYTRLVSELERPDIREDFFRIRVISDAPISARDEDKVLSTFKLDSKDVKKYVGNVQLNTDDKPVLEFKAALQGIMKKEDPATQSLHSILDLKSKDGAASFEPPLTNAYNISSDKDVFPYMRLEVQKGEDWLLEGAKLEYIHLAGLEGAVLYYDNKYVVYRLPAGGLLAAHYVEIFPEPDSSMVEGYIRQAVAPESLKFVGYEKGADSHHTRMKYDVTLPVGNLRGSVHAWYCKDITALYIVTAVSPRGFEDSQELQRATCMHETR